MGTRLDDIDLRPTLSFEESEKRIRAAQHRLVQLRLFTAGLIEPHEVGPGLVVLFEGFDAAGKGGAIRRLAEGFDPRHVRVVPIGPPTDEEKRHHFLWRFSDALPGIGEMTIFDRSWYGRGLVERVEGLISVDEARHSLAEIAQFEHALAHAEVTIVKFWLQVSPGEQLKRFEKRRDNPVKRWKLTEDDWRNRDKRADYERAMEEVLEATDAHHAHWNLISGEDKNYARATVLETLAKRWVRDLERRGISVPPASGGDYLA
ncbi:MAG TPA: UDP-galactose-lipid carrier transferase [Acidimicrobiales bacterium]|nr:UDP-galactose-lipid carrier transferase [Acidimicrobiales bacterium]